MEGVGFGQPPFCNFIAWGQKVAEIRGFVTIKGSAQNRIGGESYTICARSDRTPRYA